MSLSHYRFPKNLTEFDDIVEAMQTNPYYRPYYVTHYCWGQIARTCGLIVAEPSVATLNLGEVVHVSLDSTYAVAPNPFLQIATAIADIGGASIILASAFMIRRTTSAYTKFLQAIKEKYPTLKPKFWMTDYENALMRATRNVFPESEHHCCRFHYGQALFRKTVGKLLTKSI